MDQLKIKFESYLSFTKDLRSSSYNKKDNDRLAYRSDIYVLGYLFHELYNILDLGKKVNFKSFIEKCKDSTSSFIFDVWVYRKLEDKQWKKIDLMDYSDDILLLIFQNILNVVYLNESEFKDIVTSDISSSLSLVIVRDQTNILIYEDNSLAYYLRKIISNFLEN